MAALGSQSIASSYEQLLHVDRDGGGNSTTHVSIKDGDNGTTFGFTIATDALMMSSTNRLEFGDTGTYIHQSADGVLDLVSDTEIEINATTIDINGAVAMDGAMTGGTNITISGELDAATLDISGDADIDGTLEADSYTVNGTALATYIRDTVGTNMLSSNTDSVITVTYDTSNDNIDFAVDAAQTGITSLLATDIKIGEDDQTKIDFETADEIHFYAANAEQVYVADGVFGPQTDSDVDLGSNSVRWKDAYVDSVTSTGAISGTTGTFSGVVDVTDTTDASDATGDTGALRTEGGASIAKKLYVGTDLDVDGTANLDVVDIDGAVDMASTLAVGGDVTIASATSGKPELTIKNTNDDAQPTYLKFVKDTSTSAADNDEIAKIEFYHDDDGNNQTRYGAMIVSATDTATSSEDTKIRFMTRANATDTDTLALVSGQVGIGETAPLGTMHVKTSDSGVSSPDITDLVVETSGSGGISILTGTGGQGEIAFGDSGDPNIGRIAYNHGSNYLATVVNGSEVMRITSAGFVGIGPTSPNSFLHVEADDGEADNNYVCLFQNKETTDGRSKGVMIQAGSTADDWALNIEDHDGSNNLMTILGNGAVTKSKTPAFSATPASTQTDITANNSYHTVVFGTEIFDQGANFASSVFTAPATGRYQLNVSVEMQDVDTAATDIGLKIATSNRDYHCQLDPNFSADLTVSHWQISVLADMDASDTAQVSFAQNGGTAQANITTNSSFSGYLAC